MFYLCSRVLTFKNILLNLAEGQKIEYKVSRAVSYDAVCKCSTKDFAVNMLWCFMLHILSY